MLSYNSNYYRYFVNGGVLMTEKQIIKMIGINPINIKNIQNLSNEIKLAAIKENWKSIKYIKDPTDEMKKNCYRY